MTSDLHRTVDTPETGGTDEHRWARERAEMIQGLYIHVIVYLAINAGLAAINWVTLGDDGSWWFYWPLLFWGLGLVVHVLFAAFPVFSPEWVERRSRRIAERR